MERSIVPLILIFLSQFVLGIGTSLYMSLGQAYLDDNTKKTRTPLLLGITMALRTVGPAFGFILGFACLNLYIDPSLTPVIDRRDPRWLGAWWLGKYSWSVLFRSRRRILFSITVIVNVDKLKKLQTSIYSALSLAVIVNSPWSGIICLHIAVLWYNWIF